MVTIAQPYIQTGEWPTWDYVHAVHQRRGQDADVLLESLPYSGNPGVGFLFYGFTTRAGRLQPDEKIGLTIAATLPLGELHSIIAEPFLRVLHHMIDLQDSIPLAPGKVTQARLHSRDLTTAARGLRDGFVARLPDLLYVTSRAGPMSDLRRCCVTSRRGTPGPDRWRSFPAVRPTAVVSPTPASPAA